MQLGCTMPDVRFVYMFMGRFGDTGIHLGPNALRGDVFGLFSSVAFLNLDR